jgi:Sulfotransferase family
MIISQKRKFIFFHNPKAAGTSFRKAIEEYHDFGREFWGEEFCPYLDVRVDLAHLRAWELPCVAPNLFADLDKYRKLVLVRNPTRRFLSACFEHFYKYRPEVQFGQQDSATQRDLIHRLMHEELTAGKVLSDVRYVHFSAQHWYVFLGPRRIVDHVLPVRSGEDDLGSAFDVLELPRKQPVRLNQRAAGLFDKLVSREIEQFVTSFYKRDYELLEAHDHLKSLLAS